RVAGYGVASKMPNAVRDKHRRKGLTGQAFDARPVYEDVAIATSATEERCRCQLVAPSEVPHRTRTRKIHSNFMAGSLSNRAGGRGPAAARLLWIFSTSVFRKIAG